MTSSRITKRIAFRTTLLNHRNSVPQPDNPRDLAIHSMVVSRVSTDLRRRQVVRGAFQPPPLRFPRTADYPARSREARDIEYALLLSGHGVNILQTKKVEDTFKVKFPTMIKREFRWWLDLPFWEQQAITAKYGLTGGYVKIQFTSDGDRRRARATANFYYLGGRMLKMHFYSPRKQAPAAVALPNSLHIPSAPDFSDLIGRLPVDGDSHQLGPVTQRNSNMDLNDVTVAFSQMQLSCQLALVTQQDSNMNLNDITAEFSRMHMSSKGMDREVAATDLPMPPAGPISL